MEYIELGKKEPDYGCDVMASKKRKMKMYYPHFRCEKPLPIRGKDVGKEVVAVVRLKVNSVEKRVKDGKEPTYDYSFDVKKIRFPHKDISTVAGMKKAIEQI